ncbi:MAG: short chain dehydrogenase [Fimbriimonadales bacterium]|nr:MAG: short chain dehydrogenase [Fimbriimonadales bacterium]
MNNETIQDKCLQNRVAIITGASRGIGRAIALKFAQAGANIVVAAKTAEPDPRLPGTIYTVAEEVEAFGVRALPIRVDVRDENALQQMVDKTLETFGRIDILINNAGALWWYPVLETPPKRFDLVMQVNLRASFIASQLVLPPMINQHWGHIITMSPPIDLSVLPGKVAYMISKFGMTMLALGLAEEVRAHNVAVNALWPRTLIESQATLAWGLGTPQQWRKADIMADAALELVRREPHTCTGNAWIDEDLLREAGINDFSSYNCTPDGEPMEIVWQGVQAGKRDG